MIYCPIYQVRNLCRCRPVSERCALARTVRRFPRAAPLCSAVRIHDATDLTPPAPDTIGGAVAQGEDKKTAQQNCWTVSVFTRSDSKQADKFCKNHGLRGFEFRFSPVATTEIITQNLKLVKSFEKKQDFRGICEYRGRVCALKLARFGGSPLAPVVFWRFGAAARSPATAYKMESFAQFFSLFVRVLIPHEKLRKTRILYNLVAYTARFHSSSAPPCLHTTDTGGVRLRASRPLVSAPRRAARLSPLVVR